MEGLSFYDIVDKLHGVKTPLVGLMILLPFVSWGGGTMLKKVSKSTAARFLSIPVYVAVIPGTCCTLIIAYLILIAHVNVLKDIDLIICICVGPILSMAATLWAISKIMSFDDIPRFDRLSGLIITSSVSFILIFILSRLHIFVGFFASIYTFVFGFIILFILLKIGVGKLK